MSYDKDDLIADLIDFEPTDATEVAADIRDYLESIDFEQFRASNKDVNLRWIKDNLNLPGYFDESTNDNINKLADVLLEEIFLDDEMVEIKKFFSDGDCQIRSKNVMAVKFTIDLGKKLISIQQRVFKIGVKTWESFVDEFFGIKLRTVNVAMLLARSNIDEKYYYLTAGVLENFASYAKKENNISINNFIKKFIETETNEALDDEEIKNYAKKYCEFRRFHNKLPQSVKVDESLVKASIYANAVVNDKTIEDLKKISESGGDCGKYFEHLVANRSRPKEIGQFLAKKDIQDNQENVGNSIENELTSPDRLEVEDIDVGAEKVEEEVLGETRLSSNSSISLIIGTLICKCENIVTGAIECDAISSRQITDGIDALNKLSQYWHPKISGDTEEECAE